MNVKLLSNTPNAEGNTNYNNKFAMSLPEQIDAENGAKVIRVLNVTYPLTIDNVAPKSCGVRLKYKWSGFRGKKRGPYVGKVSEVVHFDTSWLFVPPGYYTLPKLLEVLNAYLNEYGVYFIVLPSKRVGVTLNVSGLTFTYRYSHGDRVTSIPYENDGSEKSVEFEMTKDLKYMLGLDQWVLHPQVMYDVDFRGWETRNSLLQIISSVFLGMNAYNKPYNAALATFYGQHLPDMTNGLTRMFIYCDEVVDSVVGNTHGKILVMLQIETDAMGSAHLYTYTCPETSTKLIRAKIDKFHIKVCDSEFNLIQFSAGTLGIECIVE
jgi:hypothetical protein